MSRISRAFRRNRGRQRIGYGQRFPTQKWNAASGRVSVGTVALRNGRKLRNEARPEARLHLVDYGRSIIRFWPGGGVVKEIHAEGERGNEPKAILRHRRAIGGALALRPILPETR